MIGEYYRLLERNRKFFGRAREIAMRIKEKAREMFPDCEVFLAGSYVKKTYTLSSDLDILIVSSSIPKKLDFEWYKEVVQALTCDDRINIHLVNKESFKGLKKFYTPRVRI